MSEPLEDAARLAHAGAEPTEPSDAGGPSPGRPVGRFDFRNTRFWVTLLLVLLVALNAAALGIYALAHPNESFSLQLWTYAESDTAKLITASMILPLLVFVVEGRFNVAETVRSSRVERARKAQDARRDARLEAIVLTSQAWSELFALTTLISSPDPDAKCADLRSKLWTAPTVFQDRLYRWRIRFPNLADEGGQFISSYTFLVNVLIECAASALFHIQSAETEAERADVRGSIDLITSGIDHALSDTVPTILNASLELLEIRESFDVEELRMVETDAKAGALTEAYEAQITSNIEIIDAWADFVRSRVASRDLLATVDGPEVVEFRRLFDELATAIREDPSVPLADEPRLGALETSYGHIPRADRLHAWNVKYSSAWLAELADSLVFQDFAAELGDPTLSPSS